MWYNDDLLLLDGRMVYLLTTIHVIVCIFLAVVVLLQSGKATDLAGASWQAGARRPCSRARFGYGALESDDHRCRLVHGDVAVAVHHLHARRQGVHPDHL